MSMLTRCPACTTIYRVVPDQLRISQGWVKCGQCGDIFDATQHLVQIEQQTPVGDDPDTVVHDDSAAEPEQVPLPEQVPQDPQLTPLASEASAVTDAPAQWVPMRESAIDDETDPQPVASAEPDAEKIDPTPELTQVSFLRPAKTMSRWHRTGVRVALLGVTLLLTAALALQWIYRQRDWLAAAFPQTQPTLQAACAVLGCQVQPLQQIEAVLIDAAAFNKIEDGRYVLSCVVKNTAPWPLAAPGIELTLTDLQDKVVVRKVFAPHELDASVMMLSPQSEWRVNTPLTLALAESTPAIVGYRVRVFYP